MKFILSFLFTFIFISPVMAAYNLGTSGEICSDINNSDNCKTQVGCGDYDNELGCSQCQSGTYNDGNFTACRSCVGNSDYEEIQQDQTKQHPAGASSCSDWECISGTPVDTDEDGILDSCSICRLGPGQVLPEGTTDCNAWWCAANWYREDNSCVQCPEGAWTDGQNKTSISDCHCSAESDEYIIANPEHVSSYGYPYFCGACGAYTTYDRDTFSCVCNITYSYQSSLLACACPAGSNSDGTQCVCESNYYMNTVSGHCALCPADATCSNNEVTCDQNTIKTVSPDGTVTCATCGANASVVSNVCTCDANFYGNGTNCTKCPAGTFLTTRGTEASPTAVTGCHMTHETLFCDANGENCMQLIPES